MLGLQVGEQDSQVNTLSGFAGAYGGLFSSTVIVVLLILEVARPGGQRFTKALAAGIVASSVSFGIYFAIAGAVFLDDYQVPPYKFEDWQLLAGVPLGLFAALVIVGESKVEQAVEKAGLKAEKHVAKELDVSPKDVDKAVQEAAGALS